MLHYQTYLLNPESEWVVLVHGAGGSSTIWFRQLRDRFEVIFFRNVMIYFDKPTQEDVIRKLCQHLVPGGYLFVGHSESLAGLNVPVRCVATAIYQKMS
jgi:chemotaxis methyl-accepting protein methylase